MLIMFSCLQDPTSKVLCFSFSSSFPPRIHESLVGHQRSHEVDRTALSLNPSEVAARNTALRGRDIEHRAVEFGAKPLHIVFLKSRAYMNNVSSKSRVYIYLCNYICVFRPVTKFGNSEVHKMPLRLTVEYIYRERETETRHRKIMDIQST